METVNEYVMASWNTLYNLVNPLTPYMIADYYISDEIYDENI